MAELLVSVRSAAEAESALRGGAAIIDVKEPARGALGRADDTVLRAVLEAVAGRRPVSAALGEWAEDGEAIPSLPLSYVKFGLAGAARKPWRAALERMLEERKAAPQMVLVGYADWECAQAPPLDEVVALAGAHPGGVLLIDTHCKEANNVLRKDKPTLLDWLRPDDVEAICAFCREARVHVALAGSLGIAEIAALLPARPDWFAVRGAACVGNRHTEICADRVRGLADVIASAAQVDQPHAQARCLA